jgi:hypothetical protein
MLYAWTDNCQFVSARSSTACRYKEFFAEVSFPQAIENDLSKQDDRVHKITQWLEHLQCWRDSGKSLAAYAKEHGLALWAIYHWRGVLIRQGRWHPEPKTTAKSGCRSTLALRFARITVTDRCPPMLLTVRLHVTNGRRAEIDLMGIEQLGAILGVLERQP